MSSRLESSAFYVLLATIVLAPIAFLPTQYIPIEAVKTALITAGSIASLFLYALASYRERKAVLPPKGILGAVILVAISVVLSSLTSGQIERSLFGQGFEIGTASFILALFAAALAAYSAVARRPERTIVIYAGMVASFLILFVFHFLRFLIGPSFATLGILNGVTASIFGSWLALGAFATLAVCILVPAAVSLPLSRRLKILYWIIIVIALSSAFIANSPIVWGVMSLVFLGLSIYSYASAPRTGGRGIRSALSRMPWAFAIAFVLTGIVSWQDVHLAGPVVSRIGANYGEISLPWQMTLDVTAGTLKDSPILGAGPNRFAQALRLHKPAELNASNAWNVEFASGFGLLPTFAATQGILGIVAWLLFLVSFGLLGYRALRAAPSDPRERAWLASSFSGSAFCWIIFLVYNPSHAFLAEGFVLTGVFAALAVRHAGIPSTDKLAGNGRRSKVFSILLVAVMALLAIWFILQIKQAVGLAYFGSGVKQLSVHNDPALADQRFATALAIDQSDTYWQARAEAGIAKVRALAASVSATSSKESADAAAKQATDIVNQSLAYSIKAIAYDPENYYNYVSEARVSELASNLKMNNGYENAVKSYGDAIRLNSANPSLYLSLAQLQANNGKYDDALHTIGAVLQIKPNYLDAVFLLSQVEAAKGDLPNAITAAKVATTINPGNPLVYFQLGLLQYTNRDYSSAADSLNAAIKATPGYANAQYFLGLSYVRLGRISDAITQFEALAKSNPDSQEVSLILANLKAGKSPFTDAKPPITAAPEKRPALPIKEKR